MRPSALRIDNRDRRSDLLLGVHLEQVARLQSLLGHLHVER
jgi:hypothetical protein